MSRLHPGWYALPLLALALEPTAARAQEQRPPGRVLVYAEPNYRGEPLVIEAGTAVANLNLLKQSKARSWNDRILSVKIEGPVVLVAYQNPSFWGATTTITRNSADLNTLSMGNRDNTPWAKQISSVRAEPAGANGPVVMEWTRRDAERAVRSAFQDILGRDPDARGLDTYRRRLMNDGWTEDHLRDQLRQSPEFKQRDLDAVVRREFQAVLGRDPDSSGLATYKRALEGGMSTSELRADLKRSGEAAKRDANTLVTRAYREVLRREPDESGLATYTKLILERGWDDHRLREALRNSDEFRNLPRR